jgi:chromosome partitioning protein
VRRLALWNAKGGTGKTTVAVNLAGALAERGRRVLLLDLDAQASATRALGETPANGLLDALRGTVELESLVTKTQALGVECIRGSPELTRAERSLSPEAGAERLLAVALEELPERWDYLLIDCGPGVSLLSVNALAAVREHVAPIDPSPFSVAGLADALDLADAVRKRLNRKLSPTRILVSRLPRTRAGRITSEGLRERFGELVFRAEIPERAVVVEASGRREPLVTYAPTAPVTEAFRALAEEVEE